MRLLIVFSCMLALSAHCADTDEARFKPQPYKPGKELNAKTYSEKTYSASDKAAAHTIGTPMTPAQMKQPEMKPLVTKEQINSKSLETPAPMKADPFKQGDKETYVPTISPPSNTDMARKPFVASTNKVGNTAFVPAEKPKGKDPMLEPRQGIKVLPTDTK